MLKLRASDLQWMCFDEAVFDFYENCWGIFIFVLLVKYSRIIFIDLKSMIFVYRDVVMYIECVVYFLWTYRTIYCIDVRTFDKTLE